jgi:hypothetical protein
MCENENGIIGARVVYYVAVRNNQTVPLFDACTSPERAPSFARAKFDVMTGDQIDFVFSNCNLNTYFGI